MSRCLQEAVKVNSRSRYRVVVVVVVGKVDTEQFKGHSEVLGTKHQTMITSQKEPKFHLIILFFCLISNQENGCKW